MRIIFQLTLLLNILMSCGQTTTERTVTKSDSINANSPKSIPKTADIFSDANFTFLHLDSLSEEMLRDQAVQRDYKYIQSVKRFKKEHCTFFKTGCSNSFFDEHVFLVSKQQYVGDILPVIIHDSKDFDYYHAQLYTLDKQNNKIDSVLVSLTGSGLESDEPQIIDINKVFSRFSNDSITTTELEYRRFENDSTVTLDSTIVYRKIEKDGHITVIKKDKLFKTAHD